MPIIETATTTTTILAKAYFTSLCFLLSSFMVYLGINVEAITMFSVLLGIDYLTGLVKARAINESITSHKMKYGAISKVSLILIPVAIAVSGKAMDIDTTDLVFVSLNMLVLSELYSVVGNIYAIRTKNELPEYDVVAIIGKRVKTLLLKTMEDK